jgi:hypothetical protein
MATLAELLVKIKTDKAETTADIKKVKSDVEKADKQIKQTSSNIAASIKKIGATFVALGVAKFAKDFISFAGEIDSVGMSFKNLAKNARGGSDGLLAAMRVATRETVDNLELMRSSNLALQLMGEDVAEHLPRMAEIAAAAARTQGKTVQQMMNDIVVATGRQSVMILDNLGISSATAAQEIEKYAAKLGKTRDQLSDAEKKAAFFNAVMVAGGEIVSKAGDESITLGESLQRLKTTFTNIAIVVGERLAPYIRNFVENVNTVIKTIQKIREAYLKFSLTVNKINTTLALTDRQRIGLLQRRIEILKELQKIEGEKAAFEGKPAPKIPPDPTFDPEKREKEINELLKIEQEYYRKSAEQRKQGNILIDLQESEALNKLMDLKTLSDEEREGARLRITEYYAEQRKQVEIQKAQESAMAILGVMQGLTGQLGGILNQYIMNRQINLDNQQNREQRRIDEEYEARKEELENTIADETELAEALKLLDEEKARETELLNEKFEKKKRKLQREAAKKQKKLAIFETLLSIPQAAFAAYKSLVGIPYIGPILAAAAATAATALGLAKLALIKQQPLPEAARGGVFNEPYIGGEAGREMAVPLESENGRTAIRELASGMLDVMSQEVNTSASVSQAEQSGSGYGGDVYLDGEKVGKWLTKGSANGLFTIHPKVVVA